MNISKQIERAAEMSQKLESLRDEILNDPDMPQGIKDVIIENRKLEQPVVELISGRKIKYINPDTFEIEYESSSI